MINMKEFTTNMIVICALAFIVVLLLITKCTGSKEGYKRSGLAADCALQRTPVDYTYNPTGNPHYSAQPTNEHQPLDQGPIDFYSEQRRLNQGRIFEEFGTDWEGKGGDQVFPNDEKTRFDLTNAGDVGFSRQLQNAHQPQHGQDLGMQLTPQERPDPYTNTHRMYGGYGYHSTNVYGD